MNDTTPPTGYMLDVVLVYGEENILAVAVAMLNMLERLVDTRA